MSSIVTPEQRRAFARTFGNLSELAAAYDRLPADCRYPGEGSRRDRRAAAAQARRFSKL